MNSIIENYIRVSCNKRELDFNSLDLTFIKKLEKFMLTGKTKNFHKGDNIYVSRYYRRRT